MRHILLPVTCVALALASSAQAALTFAHDFENPSIDQSESGHTLVPIPTGGAAITSSVQANGSNSGNFTGGGLGLGNAAVLNKNKATFETWVNIADGTAGLATNSLFGPQIVLDWEGTSFSQNHLFIGLGEFGGGVYVRADIYDNTSQWDYNYSQLPASGDGWVHIAASWDFTNADTSDYFRMYVNGSQTFELTGKNYNMVQTGDNVAIGTTWSRNPAKDLNKTLDRIRLYDTTIDAVYDMTGNSFTPSTAAVPEPATLGFAAIGAGLLMARRRHNA